MSAQFFAVVQGARRPGHRTVRTRFFSLRLNYRVFAFVLVGLIVLALLMTLATSLGSFRVPFADVVRAVLGKGSEDQLFVVRELRLPRVISAVLIGAALALSGAIFQGLVKNPLVSPDIIGIESGATVMAVFWIVTKQNYDLLPLAAFLGASLSAAAIYLLSWKRGIAANRLILVGIGVGAALSAWTTFLLIRYPLVVVRSAQVWTMGSLYGNDWSDVQTLLITVGVLLPVAIALTWPLRAMQLGDDITRGLGLPLETTRLFIMAVGCALAAVAVSIAGPIGFVALMVPHMARMMVGPLSGSVMLFVAVLGAIFLLGADIFAQHALPVSLPVGIITAVVGAPYFLFLLYRTNARL
jgi:iron complex transport system permease protein